VRIARLYLMVLAIAVAAIAAAPVTVLTLVYNPQPSLSESHPGRFLSGAILEARTDRDIYYPGEEALIEVTVSNLGEGHVEIYSPDGCKFAFYVQADGHGPVVYRLSYDACTLAIFSMTLGPGESYTTLVAWWALVDAFGQILPPGHYSVCPTLFSATIQPEVTDVACGTFEIQPREFDERVP